MGDSWNDKNGNPVNDPKLFREDMKIGDIVMVRDGSTPIALVQITGNAYIEQNIDKIFDWFKLRRKIKLLDFFEEETKIILDEVLKKHGSIHIQAPGTLTFCKGSNATNDFIEEWSKQINYKN